MDYDEFDYKIREPEYTRSNSVEFLFTNNGYQWMTIQIPREHVREVAEAMIRYVT